MKKSIYLLLPFLFLSCKKFGYEIENYNFLSGKYKIARIINNKGNDNRKVFPYDTLIFSIQNGLKKGRNYNIGELKVNNNLSFNFNITNAFIFKGVAQYPSATYTPIEKIYDNLDYQLLIGNWEIIKIDSKSIHLKKSFVTDYKDYTKDSEIIFEKI